MADGFSFKIEGAEELNEVLKSLSDDLQYKGGRFALRKAAQVIRDDARNRAANVDDTATREFISANIVERFSRRAFQQRKELMFRVGVLGGARATGKEAERSRRRRAASGVASLESLGEIAGKGKGNPGGDTWYWRLLEFGTSRTQAKPFMRPALERNANQATITFVREYDKASTRAIRRAKKKK